MAKKAKPLPLANPVPDRFDLIPWGAVCQVARTTTDALKDHDEGGWRSLSRREHVSRTLRHLALYLSGDTSEEHLEHATCRMLMALDNKDEPKYQVMTIGPGGSVGIGDLKLEDTGEFTGALGTVTPKHQLHISRLPG